MFQCCVYDLGGLVLRRAAGYDQKKPISLNYTPLCFTFFLHLSLFFPIPCPVDLHSEITSAKEQVEEINQGKREASSSPGNVRVLILIKWSPESLLFNLIHRHRHLLLWNSFYVLFTHTICARVGYMLGKIFISLSSWVPIFLQLLPATFIEHMCSHPFILEKGKINSAKESSCPHVSRNLMEEPGLESKNPDSYLCDIADDHYL